MREREVKNSENC